ncbi:MAG: NAD-dependent epimerase/dehydratase family protein [Bacillota bacterium]
MKVLVTGGAGFIGSHTVDALEGAGAAVAVLDNLSTGKFENIKQYVDFYQGDLLEKDFVFHCVEKESPDVIIHLAAQVSVPQSMADPVADAGINILGSLHILEAARSAGVRKIVFASSAAVYGTPVYLPVDELHPAQPLSGYGLSKHTVERYLHLYRELYGLDYTILRYANVYGPGQDAMGEGGVVSIFIDRIINGEQPVIYGDGEQTRDFVHVSDVAGANLCAMNRGGGMVLNVSTGRPVTVNRLFEIIKKAAGYSGGPRYGPRRPGDIRDSCLDSSRAASVLGWTAGTDLEKGIKNTLQQKR